MISDKLIKELQLIIKEEYDRDLTTAEVSKIGNDLINTFKLLAQIDKRIN